MGKNWTQLHQHVPLYVNYLWKAGCRRPEAVVISAFLLQAQAELRHHKSDQFLQQEIP